MEEAVVPALLLKNGGRERNMCSLNSIIQLLRHMPEFKVKISNLKKASPIHFILHSIISNCGTGILDSALALRGYLAQAANQPLNSGAQYDTIELFTYLLNHIPNELFQFNTTADYRFLVENRPSACPSCQQRPPSTSESDRILKIALPSTNARLSLDNLLRQHFLIRRQLDGRRCAACLSRNPNTPKIPYLERFSISKYPQYIILQILRMEYRSGKTVKKSTQVSLPNHVMVDKVEYNVIGTISHMGTAEAGHNRAYLKEGPNWYLCEDSCMPEKKEPVDDDLEQTYCVLLQKCESSTEKLCKQPKMKECKVVLEPLPDISKSRTASSGKPTQIPPRRSHSFNGISKSETEPINDSQKRTFSSVESINSQEDEACQACGKTFSRLFSHLTRSKDCSLLSNIEGRT